MLQPTGPSRFGQSLYNGVRGDRRAHKLVGDRHRLRGIVDLMDPVQAQILKRDFALSVPVAGALRPMHDMPVAAAHEQRRTRRRGAGLDRLYGFGRLGADGSPVFSSRRETPLR